MSEKTPARWPRRWPLVLLALPAGVATWSGWVGLGELTGFGPVKPLPGIADVTINSAITLPIGVEAYAALAMSAWLTSAPVKDSTRAFARASAIGALVLGMLGQVAYHLLEVQHSAKVVRIAQETGQTIAQVAKTVHPHAPWWVTIFVSCLPVLVLGLGAGLAHMIHRDRTSTHSEIRRPDVRTSADLAGIAIPLRTDSTPIAYEPPIVTSGNMIPDHVPADTPSVSDEAEQKTSGRQGVQTSRVPMAPPVDEVIPAGTRDEDPEPDPSPSEGLSDSRTPPRELSAREREDGARLAALASDAARVRAALDVLGMEAGPAEVRAWLTACGVQIGAEYVKTVIKRARKAAREQDQGRLSLVKESG
ncbi:hypothetical protein [Actinomadura hibisca]|uniref:hypothetical protein n=1 Tax=Actinomadura hibisca TaxID=68565 RepID=UPI00082CE61B|nr:hypothetical protein [Actinomadura hibisca]